MSQEAILKILENNKNKPLSLGEIASLMDVGLVAVSRALKQLLVYEEVKVIEIDREQAKKYNCKRKIRLYYC